MALVVFVAGFAVAPGSDAVARARGTTVRQYGAIAKLPAGWRNCPNDQVVHARRCNQPNFYSAASGGISIYQWQSRFRGDTCTRQHFTNGRPGPRIAAPKRVKKNFRRHGWAAPYANRTVIPDQSGAGRTLLLYLVCARTSDRRVVTVSFIGVKSRDGKALIRGLWAAAASIRAIKVPVYLPGGYPKRIKPARASWTGDGSGVLRNMTWRSWNSRAAVGRGTESLDDCNPSCAEGHFTDYPVRLHARKPQYLRCGMFFSAIDVRYTKRVPPHRKRAWTFRVDPSDNALMLYTNGPCSG